MYAKAHGRILRLAHDAGMPKSKPGHFLREWRKRRELSLEAVAEKVVAFSNHKEPTDYDGPPLTMTHATLSRIERGLIPYNQHLLEVLADIYQTDEASLVMRNPTDPDGLWTIYDALTQPERVRLVELAKTLKRTG